MVLLLRDLAIAAQLCYQVQPILARGGIGRRSTTQQYLVALSNSAAILLLGMSHLSRGDGNVTNVLPVWTSTTEAFSQVMLRDLDNCC